MTRKITFLAAVLIFSLSSAFAQFGGPFSVSSLLEENGGAYMLSVTYSVDKPKAYFYKDMLGVDAPDGVELILINKPKGKLKYDQFLEKEVETFGHPVTYAYEVRGAVQLPLAISVRYQGCDDELCYRPMSEDFKLQPGVTPVAPVVTDDSESVSESGAELIDEFTVVNTAAGYLTKEQFVGFLDESESGAVSGNLVTETFEKSGLLAVVLLVILAGLGLNLTPCVLPMIPVNIAIIGAGTEGGSRARGFALGGTYGLGISLAYGILGLLFVLGGKPFGSLNSNPGFNIGVGLVFLMMSLAMFGVFNIDLTRYQGNVGSGGGKGSFGTAFVLGAISALLAGACVAPMLFSTLLFALDIYTKGNPVGLLLPFLLGVGMALPWPFAGAGLSFLPKAGKWMEHVKHGFGVIIIFAAIYYIGLGVKLIIDQSPSSKAEVAAVAGQKEGWLNSLDEALEQSKAEGKPVFIDFWASWCKNCLKMEKTTFKEGEVINRLYPYIKVKYDATDQSDPKVKAVLGRYVEVGLPTYVVLEHAK
ncbi:hypothetical protein BVX97_06460 [bacterium E08(2017)]|nr:hypothetical protein BVX97_06460 [bacterium E08(2017)]